MAWLFYVKLPERRLRTIRVFDAGDRLVRTYDGFVYKEGRPPIKEGGPPIPERFRVTSIPANSYTTFRIDPLDHTN